MNAAARLVHQSALSRHLVLTHLVNQRQMILLALTIAILFSAVSIIYATHTSRVLNATIQRQLVERDHLHGERSQLLLERSALMMQARVQHIAESKLGMMMPTNKSTVIVRE